MAKGNFKYDVAISFLVQDISLAKALYDRLSEGLEVFFFPRSQEELAGTDGLESMRVKFRDESRLNVVLYRPKWGNTPWTAVEATAIKDSCLATAFRSLFFFVVEPTQELPTWLPETHVRFNYSDFPLDQAVGAIKLRVQERGGHYTPITPIRKAEILKAKGEFRSDKARMSSDEGRNMVFAKVEELFDEVRKHCDEVNAAGDVQIRYAAHLRRGDREQSCTITNDRVSLRVFWYQPYSNSLDTAFLGVNEFNQGLLIPPGHLHLVTPEVIHDEKLLPDLSPARDYGWTFERKPERFISSKELANHCVLQLLDLIDRDASGKVKRKGWG